MSQNVILADSCSEINGFERGESSGARRRAAGFGASGEEEGWVEYLFTTILLLGDWGLGD